MPTSPKGLDAVEMVNVGTIEVEVAIDQALTVRLGIVEVALLLNCRSPELNMTESPMASPNVVLFSTRRVDAVVDDNVCPPTDVKECAIMSPSASTKNFEESPTAAAISTVSNSADAVLTRNEELSSEEVASPMAQTEKEWAIDGTLVSKRSPEMVDVPVFEMVNAPTDERLPEESMTKEEAGADSWKITDLLVPASSPFAISMYPATVVVPVESRESPEEEAVKIPVTVKAEIVVVARVDSPETSKVEENTADVPESGLDVEILMSSGISESVRFVISDTGTLLKVMPESWLILVAKDNVWKF